jgi:hypothetical protein
LIYVEHLLPAPITSPNTTFQNADDEYNRLKSQFGGHWRVPTCRDGFLAYRLHSHWRETSCRTEGLLRSQQEVGERNIGDITESLAYKDPRYQKGGKLEQWAKANPMLAMREFNKLGSQPLQRCKALATNRKLVLPSVAVLLTRLKGALHLLQIPLTLAPQPTLYLHLPCNKAGQSALLTTKHNAMAAQKTAGATGMPNFETTPEAQTR